MGARPGRGSKTEPTPFARQEAMRQGRDIHPTFVQRSDFEHGLTDGQRRALDALQITTNDDPGGRAFDSQLRRAVAYHPDIDY